MPHYKTLGTIPHKRHTVFRQENGELYHEQLFGTIGFDGMSSLLYHVHPPTKVNDILKSRDVSPKVSVEKNMQMRAFKGFDVPVVDDLIDSRVPVLTNTDVTTLYTVPSFKTAVVKSILVSEDAGSGANITVTLVDASDNIFSLFKTKAISSNATTELLTQPLVMEASEALKVQASDANELHVIASILEIEPREVTT